MEKYALFDFDGTLIRGDSLKYFSIFALGKRKYYCGLLMEFPVLLKWKLGILESSCAKERLFCRLFRGISYDEFCRKGKKFAAEIKRREREAVVGSMERYLRRGMRVVIVTASMSEWIMPWAKEYGVEDVVATGVEVGEDGMLTGKFSTPNCKGEEKVRRLREKYKDIEGNVVIGYGNAGDDDAMLALADNPLYV